MPIPTPGRPDGRGLYLQGATSMNGPSWRLIIGAFGVLFVLSMLI